MYRNLNNTEKEWLEKLLNVDIKDRDILMRQISDAHISHEKEYSFISLKFERIDSLEKYPYSVRVPVEMRAYQDRGAPVVFLIHIIDGIINELEVFTADSSEIKEEAISLEAVEYEINDEVL